MTEQPKVSPDGRFWWDGAKWVPFDLQPRLSNPTSVQNVNAGNPFASGMMGCFGVGAAVILVCILLFAGCSAMLSGASHGASNSISSP